MKKLLFGGAFLMMCLPVFVSANTIERVSVDDAGVQGNGASSVSAISSDGRYITFQSAATNLVLGDTGQTDIFVYDRTNDTTERVSVSDAGVEGDGMSSNPMISADGRYVAFQSLATVLVPGDTNSRTDIFVYDRTLNIIERVSISNAGAEGDGTSSSPTISADGRYVAFQSTATNLVVGDTNAKTDIFVYDRTGDTIERVSVSDAGAEGNNISSEPAISSDGQYVTFQSAATNLVSGDTNSATDIFVYDRTGDTIERVSVSGAGVEGDASSANAMISADGRYVAYESAATNLVANDTNSQTDAFVYDRTNDTVERVSVSAAGVQGDGVSSKTSVTSDGRYVSFQSTATNLVLGDTNGTTDIFVYDRINDTVERVSVSAAGVQGDGASSAVVPSISPDGRFIVFHSAATNLASGDTNGVTDIFVVDGEDSATLTLTTTVTNDNGGTLAVEDFPLFVDGVSIDSGVATTTLSAGSYTISETEDPAYAVTYGGDCDENGDITMEAGSTYACTVTNDDIGPTLTVTTTLTNDDRGTAEVADFTLYLDGLPITSAVATTTLATTHTLTHATPAGTTYDITWGGDCASDGTLTMSLNTTYTCTLTANDSPSNTNGGSGGSTRTTTQPHTVTPPPSPLLPPTSDTPLTPDERTKLIADIKVQVVSLIQQLVALLQQQLAGM
ncbi:PD40 domain-containing protein [Candidatus Campbellbacteria bacterium]|nr:MAG: PD40 domain-containing protein [Candidatus Campbellbacteria bacterium]